MEREILFRGKLSHSGVWVEGNLIKDRNGNNSIIPFNVFEPDGHHLIIDSDEAWRVDTETVGQFTGMTDKNGKKVFEGDIIIEKESDYDNEYRIYNVYWNEDNFQYWFSDDVTIDSHPIDELEIDYSRVIGNIHDNPELL